MLRRFEWILFLSLIIWIITMNILRASTSTCFLHGKCLDELRKFTQTDEFHVYRSLEEAEKACSEAKDAYLCVQSAPECNDAVERAKLSILIRGSYRLLNDFCGFKSKRRPCCALRSAYLEYSGCYKEISDRLNDCNEKYRKSLDAIMTLQDEYEQRIHRFCSVKWLGSCVRKTTQRYCGKVAAQVIKTYMMKAGKPEKIFVEENKKCHETFYGYAEDEDRLCEQKYFQNCRVHLLFLHEYLVEDRLSDDETFLSLCTGVHDSLECYDQTSYRCFKSKYPQISEKEQESSQENNACFAKENVLQKYRGKLFCLSTHVQRLSECGPEILTPNYAGYRGRYSEHFCWLLKKLEICWIDKATFYCGDEGKRVMSDIIEMAAINLHQSCKM